jgi:cobalt-zinc-cadmium efflux system protein
VNASARPILAAAAITVVAALVEVLAARAGGSLFLIADALHLLAHLGIFLVLLAAAPTRDGEREDSAVLAVLIIILCIGVGMALASARRLLGPPSPVRPGFIFFSVLGLAANLVTAALLRRPAERRLSFRAAVIHELWDGLLTVIALFGAGAIALLDWRWVDPALSLLVSLWLLAWAAHLIARRVRHGRVAWQRP